VERILHQTNVESEAPLELSDSHTEDNWPSKGEVEFKDYSTRYRSGLDLVLKNVSMKIVWPI
jgi:ATP-binding cassette, subfamily C (CFTR/MRP), member 1